MKKTKFIFITGGVLSSLGKGLAAASIGALLKSRGLKVTIQKLDPYINVDPGTMNPTQHGEVFVTDDGAETDLDLGHYERFLDNPMSQKNSYTSGSIYYSVISKERKGEYKGNTVQVIPHITDEIKLKILGLSDDNVDVAIVEIGGTVGDIESQPFLEAIRQMRGDLGKERCLYLHLTLVPYLPSSGEHKTKPTQHSVKELRSIGIHPDIILCRCEQPVPSEMKRKIALFCDVEPDAVFSAKDVKQVYSVPLEFYEEGLDQKLAIMLRLPAKNAELDPWKKLVKSLEYPKYKTKIAVIGQHVEVKDTYKSMFEGLIHGGAANEASVDCLFINSNKLSESNISDKLKDVNGIIMPSGFGSDGVEECILAIKYAREHKIPFFGISLGMQLAVIEFARNVLGIKEATSEEFDKDSKYKVIHLPTEQAEIPAAKILKAMEFCSRAPIRLGAFSCKLKDGTKAHQIYKQSKISERHRHHYEVNNDYVGKMEENGMIVSGHSSTYNFVEIIELLDHPWFIGCIFNPEFKSTPMNPHPIFKSFIKSTINELKS